MELRFQEFFQFYVTLICFAFKIKCGLVLNDKENALAVTNFKG